MHTWISRKREKEEIDADVFVFTTPFSRVRTRNFKFELGRGNKEKGGKCTGRRRHLERTSKKSRNVILGGDSNAQLMR